MGAGDKRLFVVIGAKLDGFERGMSRVESRLNKTGARFQQAGQALTIGVTAPLALMALGASKAAIAFDDSFTGVLKTVDDATDGFGELTEVGETLRQGFRDMAKEIPVSVNELAKIGELGGQLGVASSDLLQFTDVIAKLGVTTNLSTEEAATALARFANITGVVAEQGAIAFERIGSTVVSLGNNFATTEAEIVTFGLRIAAAGSIIGLTEAETLGFGAALSSVGVQAERGGTALNKVFTGIFEAVQTGGEKLDDFAEVAGQSADEFAASFRDNAANAVTAFIQGLQRITDEGGNVFEVLKDVEFQDERLKQALLATAGAGDLLVLSLENARAAWALNNALTREAELRFSTMSSKLQLVKARVIDVAIVVGTPLVNAFLALLKTLEPVFDKLEKLADGFAKLPTSMQQVVIGALAMAAALGPLAFLISFFLRGLAPIAGALGKLGTALVSTAGKAGLIGVAATTVKRSFSPLPRMFGATTTALGATGAASVTTASKLGTVSTAAAKGSTKLGLFGRALFAVRPLLAGVTLGAGSLLAASLLLLPTMLTLSGSWGDLGSILKSTASIITTLVVGAFKLLGSTIDFLVFGPMKRLGRSFADFFGLDFKGSLADFGRGMERISGWAEDAADWLKILTGRTGDFGEALKKPTAELKKAADAATKAGKTQVGLNGIWEGADDVAGLLALSTAELNQKFSPDMVESQRAAAAALAASTAISEEYADALKELKDRLGGAGVLGAVQLWTDALGGSLSIIGLTQTEQDELNSLLLDAIAKYEALGKVVPAAWRAAEAATRNWLNTAREITQLDLANLGAIVTGQMVDPLTGRALAGVESERPGDLSGGLPGFDPVPVGTESGVSLASSLGQSFKNTLTGVNLGAVVTAAITGGGDIGAALGATFGGSLGDTLGGFIASKLGPKLGGAIGSVFGPLGAIAGSFMGKGIQKAFGALKGLFGVSGAEQAGREQSTAFMSGVTENLSKNQGDRVRALVSQGWAQDLAEFTTVLGDTFKAAGSTQEEANRFAEKLWAAQKKGPEAVNAVIAEMGPTFAKAEEAAKALGITVEEVAELSAKVGDELEGIVEWAGKMKDRLEGSTVAAAGLNQKAQAFAETFKGLEGLKLENAVIGAQDEFERLGVFATATFAGLVSGGASALEALSTIAPTLEQLKMGVTDLGFESTVAIDKLLQISGVVDANKAVFQSIDANRQMLEGFGQAGILTNELFTALGTDTAAAFEKLRDNGVGANEAMALMQPTLQGLWEAQEKFGFTTDEATQKLLDQAEAQGIVGANMKDVNAQILDVLVAIAEVFGATIPEGIGKTQAAIDSLAPPALDVLGNKIPGAATTGFGTVEDEAGNVFTVAIPKDLDAMVAAAVEQFGVMGSEGKRQLAELKGANQVEMAEIGGAIAETFGVVGPDAVQQFAQSAMEAGFSIKGDFESTMAAIVSSTAFAADAVEGELASIQTPELVIPVFFSVADLPDISIPNITIPGLAHGGVVRSPGVFKVAEHGPEAVIPLDELGQGGGGDTTITFNIQANDTQSVRTFIEKEAIPILEDAWRQNRRGSRTNLQDIVNQGRDT